MPELGGAPLVERSAVSVLALAIAVCLRSRIPAGESLTNPFKQRELPMHRTLALLVVAAVSVAACPFLSVGFGAEPKADSPEAAAKLFIEALKKKDRKAYDAVVVNSALGNSLFEFAAAADGFKQKMIKAYGEVGWNNFQDSEGAKIKLSYNELELEELKFERDGDTAKARLSDSGEFLHTLQRNGSWQVDLEKSFDEAEETKGGLTAKSLATAFGGMAKVIQDYESKIGDDMTVDQLDKEMGAAFLSALVSAGAKPKVSISVK